MGDSLAMQLGKWMHLAGRATNVLEKETLEWREGRQAEGLVVANIQGGGMVSYWRVLGFLLPSNAGQPLPNKGFGWRKTWASHVVGRRGVDVLIFRVSHPWLKPSQVTWANLKSTIEYAKKVLRVRVIIFVTAPINNNVRTLEEKNVFHAMNSVIRGFVANQTEWWPLVLLSDLELYMDQVIRWNARRIGMKDFWLKHLNPKDNSTHDGRYTPKIAQICDTAKLTDGGTDCQVRNMLSNDGIHFCMETLGARVTANWACLIRCTSTKEPKACSRECNQKYFLLNETTIAADELLENLEEASKMK